jgi:uncharacterized protein
MTFNDDANIGSGKVSRRGRNTAIIGGGGGGLIVIALVIISAATGYDFTGILGGGTGSDPGNDEQLHCTVEQANTDIDCRVQGAAASIDAYWTKTAPSIGITYTSPHPVVIFEGQTDTGCGTATTAAGPFYCPPDQTIYLDTSFYQELQSEFGATGGPLAQMYVIAHEWGHHIQNISGIMDGLDLQDTGASSDSVRLELQADCFAGAWAGSASVTPDASGTPFLEPITNEQIADALNAAASVGDDNIQEATQGQVTPETWTHGSSAQRQAWFQKGYEQGPEGCDTFGASADQL